MLRRLENSGHLLKAGDDHYRQQEQLALLKLLTLRRPTFLQEYDLLFRWVSLWLLRAGYRLTNHQPHQVLAQVCEQLVPREQVHEMVRCRHALKYERQLPSAAGRAALTTLLYRLRREIEPGSAGPKPD